MLKYVALIPAYKPSVFLPELLKELALLGFENIVIDDGSGIEYEHIFLNQAAMPRSYIMRKMQERARH